MRKGFWIAAMGTAFVATAVSSCRTGEGERVDGARVYGTACARCHGTHGEGGVAVRAGEASPRDFTDTVWQRSRSDEELFATVVSGKGSMPSFAGVLAPAEIGALVEYLRSLEKTPVARGGAATGGAR